MKTVLEYYDIYPKVLCTQKAARITIRPLSRHVDFSPDSSYRVGVIPINESLHNRPGVSADIVAATLCGGNLIFSHHFPREQQYVILLEEQKENGWALRCEFRIYALEPDYFALRPFLGDLHAHSYRSDGVESPDIVAANYRKAGFDFLAITDHGQYEPSLEAIRAYEKLHLDFRLFPGEEVHPPQNNDHTIHFGGDYSINEKIRSDPDRYRREVEEIAETLELPGEIDRLEYASLLWVYREIREAGGLAVMVHPCWIQDYAYHIRRGAYRYLLEQRPFDALELVGGQTLEENLAQISFWQQLREEGHAVPVVGSSDSHGTVNSQWFGLAKTIVLSPTCERDDIILSVKERRAVALEQYHGEKLPRIYGHSRAVEFALFLTTEYMPLHDELCYEEGRLMKEYANGSEQAGQLLQSISGRTRLLAEKYWAK